MRLWFWYGGDVDCFFDIKLSMACEGGRDGSRSSQGGGEQIGYRTVFELRDRLV